MKPRPIFVALSILVLLLGFGLRVYTVDEDNYSWDEAYSHWLVGLPFDEMIQTTADDVHPPLYYLTLRVAKGLFGGSPFTIRYPSVLLGTLSVALAFGLGNAAGGRRIGLLTLLLMALSRINIGNSQLARNYIMATTFSTGALWAALLILRGDRRLRVGVIYALCVAAALYSFYLTIMLPIATSLAFLYTWFRRHRPRWMLLVWTGYHAAVGLLFLPWLIFAIHDVAAAGDVQPTSVDFFLKVYFVTLTTGISENWGGYLPGVGLVLGFMTLGTGLAYYQSGELRGDRGLFPQKPPPGLPQCAGEGGSRRLTEGVNTASSSIRRSALALLLAAVFVPMLVVFIMILPGKRGWPLATRYLPLLSAGFYALAAWSVFAIGRRWRWLGLVSAGVIVGVALSGLSGYHQSRIYRDLFDSAAETLAAYRQPNDAVILHNDKRWTNWVTVYPDSWTGTFYRNQIDAAAANAFVLPLWDESDAVWLVSIPESLGTDPGQEIARWLESRALASRSWTFTEATLTVYARTLERAQTLTALHPDHAIPRNLEGEIDGLLGATGILKRYPVGESVTFALYWQPPRQDDITVQMVGPEMARVFPFDAPQPAPDGGITRQDLSIPLTPDIPEGDYQLLLDDLVLHRFHLYNDAPVAATDVSAIQQRLDWRFGESITLLGYDLAATDFHPGDEIEVTLYWRADAALTDRYKVLVYTLGAYNPASNNPLWGQYDGEPFNWSLPTTRWPPGVVLTDRYVFQLDENAPPGDYQLGVVVYGLIGGQRLLIYNDQGVLLGDMATLTPVTVGE